MRRFAFAIAVVNSVVAFVRATGIVVAACMQGILHLLSEKLRHYWLTKPDGTKRDELKTLNTFRGILGLPKLVPAYAPSRRRSYQSCRRQGS